MLSKKRPPLLEGPLSLRLESGALFPYGIENQEQHGRLQRMLFEHLRSFGYLEAVRNFGVERLARVPGLIETLGRDRIIGVVLNRVEKSAGPESPYYYPPAYAGRSESPVRLSGPTSAT